MLKKIPLIVLFLSFVYSFTYSNECVTDPNFFGTLLEVSPSNVSKGTMTYQFYFYGGSSIGSFNESWNLKNSGKYGLITVANTYYVGLTDVVELDLYATFQTVCYKEKSKTSFTDLTSGLAFQILTEEKGKATPNFRILTYGIFPTGDADRLRENFDGYDSTGYGAYGNQLGMTLDKTFYTIPCYPFNLAFNVVYTWYYQTTLKGINIYGGGPYTKIRATPGSNLFFDLAGSFVFSKKLNFDIDLVYVKSFTPKASGHLGLNFDGSTPSLSLSNYEFFALAPAFEIHLKDNLAIYFGAYLTVAGRNASAINQGTFSFAYSF